MVIRYFSLCLIFVISFIGRVYTQDVDISVDVENLIYEGQPIEGNLTISHDRNYPIDPSSFTIEGKPLKTEFLREIEVDPSSDLVISIYRFSLEPQNVGLHILPEISVSISGINFHSTSTTYEVKSGGDKLKGNGEAEIILELETVIEGSTTLYPGQQLIVGYRFIFNYSVDLSKEELPLLDPKGFIKIGAKITNDRTENNLNIFEAKQMIQATQPGEFTFPPGIIVGKAYKTTRLGQKQLALKDSIGKSKEVTLIVLPFPEEGKPPSFNGAIGKNLDFSMTLQSSNTLSIGDLLSLDIKVSGEGELSTLPMPEICCQPGFSGFFQVSDIPPKENLSSNEKIFHLEMRPISTFLKAIPPLEFSYFNPQTKKYTTLKSSPIPITIYSIESKLPEKQKELMPDIKQGVTLPNHTFNAIAGEIEIEGMMDLSQGDLENRLFGTWWVLFIIPIGIVLILFEKRIHDAIKKEQMCVISPKSALIFKTAMEMSEDSCEFHSLLQKALFLQLVERGEIESTQLTPDQLPNSEGAKLVKEFIKQLERSRFGTKQEIDFNEVKDKATKLFKQLKEKSL